MPSPPAKSQLLDLPQAQPLPSAYLQRRFTHSPIDALIKLVVWSRLCSQIPIWLAWHCIIHLRITTLPKRRPVCRADVWGLRVNPDVVKNVPDIGTVGTRAGTPRRCGRSALPTGNVLGVWSAPAVQARPGLGVRYPLAPLQRPRPYWLVRPAPPSVAQVVAPVPAPPSSTVRNVSH